MYRCCTGAVLQAQSAASSWSVSRPASTSCCLLSWTMQPRTTSLALASLPASKHACVRAYHQHAGRCWGVAGCQLCGALCVYLLQLLCRCSVSLVCIGVHCCVSVVLRSAAAIVSCCAEECAAACYDVVTGCAAVCQLKGCGVLAVDKVWGTGRCSSAQPASGPVSSVVPYAGSAQHKAQALLDV